MAGMMHPPQPYCEDYHSDDSTNRANVAAKRSHPSGLVVDKPDAIEKVGPDAASDSGYSSHTAATMSSADSAPSVKSRSPPIVRAAPVEPPPSPAIRRRPTISGEDRKITNQSSPRKPLQRSGSVSRRPSNADRREHRERRPRPTPIDSDLDLRFPLSDQQSHASDPAHYPPLSPSSRRTPAYVQGSAVVETAITSRRRSSSTARARPVSYHGGVQYPAYQGYSTPALERGPPPSASAHYNMSNMQMAMNPYGGMMTPNSTNYFPQVPMHQTPQMQVPQQFSTRRPVSQYGPALVTYEQPQPQPQPINPNMSARHGPTPQSATYARFPSSFDDDSSSEEESDHEQQRRDVDRERMPPPRSARRPSQHRSKTTTELLDRHRLSESDRMSRSVTLPVRPKERDPRPQVSTANPSRASSQARRPSLIQNRNSVSYESARDSRVIVEPARRPRRESYIDLGQDVEPERRRRPSSKIYRTESIPPPTPRRRATDTDSRRREERENPVDARQKEAEAYQREVTGGDIPQFSDQALRPPRRGRVTSGASEAGSTRSRQSDRASRISQSNRTTMTNMTNGGNDIRLRVDGTAPLSLQLHAEDNQPRTIHLNPVEGGMTEVVISVAGERGESVYNGSIPSRRLLTQREDDDSIHSHRSNRSNVRDRDRDAARKPLGRRRHYSDDD